MAGYIMTTRVSASFASTVESWPVYDVGSLDDTFAAYDGPLLMLHGGLAFCSFVGCDAVHRLKTMPKPAIVLHPNFC